VNSSTPMMRPYLSVVTPSTHDMSTIRGWWEEDRVRHPTLFQRRGWGNGAKRPFSAMPWVKQGYRQPAPGHSARHVEASSSGRTWMGHERHPAPGTKTPKKGTHQCAFPFPNTTGATACTSALSNCSRKKEFKPRAEETCGKAKWPINFSHYEMYLPLIQPLPFTHPFTISKGTKTAPGPTFIAEKLDFKRYQRLRRSACPHRLLPYPGGGKMISDLEAKKGPFVEKFAFTDPDRLTGINLHHLFPQNSFLVCALDIARMGYFWPVGAASRFITLECRHRPQRPMTDYTIGIDTVEKMVAKLKEKPWPVYKIKAGPQKEDIKIMEEAASPHRRGCSGWIANAGWKLDEALETHSRASKDLGVETGRAAPWRKDDLGRNESCCTANRCLPLFADEACVAEAGTWINATGIFTASISSFTKCSGHYPRPSG